MADTTLQSTDWAYQIFGNTIYLYKINYTDQEFIAPDLDVTDGIKVVYLTGDKVFVDSAGFSDDTSPTSASYINTQDSVVYAIIEYLKHKFEKDLAQQTTDPNRKLLHERNAAMYHKEFKRKYMEAKEALNPEPKISVPKAPYAIR